MQKSPDPGHFISISLELGRVLDSESDYAGAFNCLSSAKKQLRAKLQIKDQDLAGYRNAIRHHKNVFTGQSVSGWSSESFECLPAGIVFLVGFPRSGTTLTEQILDSHPDFVTTGELPVLSKLSMDIGSVIGRPFTYPDDIVSLDRNDILMLRNAYWHQMEKALGDVGFEGKYVLDKLLDDTADFYAAVMGLWLHYREVLNNKVLETRYEDIVDDLEGGGKKNTCLCRGGMEAGGYTVL